MFLFVGRNIGFLCKGFCYVFYFYNGICGVMCFFYINEFMMKDKKEIRGFV